MRANIFGDGDRERSKGVGEIGAIFEGSESYAGGGNDRHMRYRMLLLRLLGCHRNAALCGHTEAAVEAW